MRGKKGCIVYTPAYLRDQRFVLNGRTSANAYKAETSLVRIEHEIAGSSIGPALIQAIARIEAITSVRIDGQIPAMRDLALIDILGDIDSRDFLHSRQVDSCFCERAATLDALKYLNTLRWISQTVHPGFVFTPEFILDVHSRCIYGKPADQTGARFRHREFIPVSDGPMNGLRPPAPTDLPAYIDDLCLFMNNEWFSPIAQSGFMHFQFECIKPFKSGRDRTGRALCHALFKSRGLTKGIIAPIALWPAINTPDHAKHLLPYSFRDLSNEQRLGEAMDSWTNFCAISLAAAVGISSDFIDVYTRLEESWERRFGKVSRGSAAQALMRLLPGYPYITVDFARRLIGKGLSATNDAVDRLVSAGMIKVVENDLSLGRVFEATEALSVFDRFYDAMLNDEPISRDSLTGR